jgi:putative phosphonate metabolism protein
MSGSPRYALYFTPPRESHLHERGAQAIGWDVDAQADVPQPNFPGIAPEDQRALTAEPRRYGFHATLKAPFRLADGRSPDDLLNALESFAATRPPILLGPLVVAELGSFLALVPQTPSAALDLLAAEIVATFDPFRAPLSAAERAKRLQASLTPRWQALMERWGYPYVFDEFRFHMTLTGPLPDAARPLWRGALTQFFANLEPATLDAVTLLEQPDPQSPFRVVERIALTG